MSFSRMSLAEDVAMRLRGARKPKGLAKEIAAYLIENDKTAEINSLERDIIEIRSEKTGVVELTAITAHPLQQKQLDEIKRNVKKLYPACKEVIVDQVQDDSLIGGIRLEFANHLLDLSASSKLNKLRKLIS